MSSSYTLISTQYCTANLELSASKKFSQKSQEPRCCKYFSLWINWFSNASDISFPDSLHLDRENKLLQTSLYSVNCEKKFSWIKVVLQYYMHVINVCKIRDQLALLMEEALIFIVKDPFFSSMKKKKGWSCCLWKSHVFILHQTTNFLQSSKKKSIISNLQVNCYTIKKTM